MTVEPDIRRLALALTVIVVAACAGVLGLAAWSFIRPILADLSAPEQRWCFLYLDRGAVTISYASAYGPPHVGPAIPDTFTTTHKSHLDLIKRSQESAKKAQQWSTVESKWTDDIPRRPRYAFEPEFFARQARVNEMAARTFETAEIAQKAQIVAKTARGTLKDSTLGCYFDGSLRPDVELVARCPFWLASLTPIIISVLVLSRWRNRASIGHCPTCNYNLTGNTSGICPECGTAIENPAPSP